MKLYEMNWALYPRRIGIYLTEKGITGIERVSLDAMAPETPERLKRISPFATVPVLETEDGFKIRSSIAILEYLEERFPEPNMVGTSAEERARTREVMSIADEAALQFGIWAHKGSPIFAGAEEQHSATARFAATAYLKQLRRLETVLQESGGPYLVGLNITIADCIALATVQFAKDAYGVPLPKGLASLSSWYGRILDGPSAVCPAYPEAFLALAYGLPDHGCNWSIDDIGWCCVEAA